MAGKWTTTRLGQVAAINPDAIDRDWPYPHIRYIDISSVGVGQIDVPPQWMKASDAPSRAKRLVRKGDTVLSTVRPNRRSMFFASEPGDDWVVSTGFAVLRPDTARVDPRYLYACVFDQTFTEYLVSREKGAAYPAVSPEDIASAEIPLPPLKEQQAIACILGALDDKIELSRRMNETLEAIARAIFKSWFVDFDPVRRNMARKGRGQPSPCPSPSGRGGGGEGSVEELDRLFPDAFEDSELGEIPKGWRVAPLTEGFSLTMGQSPPGDTYNEHGKGVPFYQGRRDFGVRYPTPRVCCTAPTRFADPGDTILTVRAPVGEVNMAAERCSIGRGNAILRHKSGSRSFTYYAMQALRETFTAFEANGTVFGCLTRSDLAALPLLHPPSELVKRFERTVYPLDEKIETNERQSRTLVALRDALLPKLLSGEIRVRDAERFAGGAA